MTNEGDGVQCLGSGTHTRMPEKNVLEMTDLREVIEWLRVVKKPQEERASPVGPRLRLEPPSWAVG